MHEKVKWVWMFDVRIHLTMKKPRIVAKNCENKAFENACKHPCEREHFTSNVARHVVFFGLVPQTNLENAKNPCPFCETFRGHLK